MDDWCKEETQTDKFEEFLNRLEEKFNTLSVIEAKLDYLIAVARKSQVEPENKKRRKGERK